MRNQYLYDLAEAPPSTIEDGARVETELKMAFLLLTYWVETSGFSCASIHE